MAKAANTIYYGKTALRQIVPYLVLIAALLLAYRYSYLFFHTTVEILTFAITTSLFMLMWNTRRIVQNQFFILLSIAYLFVGIINFFHTLSYRGLPIFSAYSETLSSQLWIAERFLLAVSFPFTLLFLNRRFHRGAVLMGYAVITALLLASIFIWKIMPVTYVQGRGLTLFKLDTEYVIIGVFVIGTVLLCLKRHLMDPSTFRFLAASMVLNIIAELMFTVYTDVYAFITVLAHILVFFSYYMTYRAIIEIGLNEPYRLMFREIQELNQRKDELLNVTSHELKNPFTSIMLYSELLQKELGRGKHNENIARMLSRIQGQTRRINQIIGDLSDVAKISTGHMEMNMTETDPAALVSDAVEEFRLMYPRRTFTLKTAKLPPAKMDRERIFQVVENLIGNAVKYSPENTPITIRLAKKGANLTFSVKDRGVGIPKKDLGKIFDKYYRSSNGGSAKGLGLGLYICKEIIGRHQGKIWAESTLRKGSTFYFSLPVKV